MTTLNPPNHYYPLPLGLGFDLDWKQHLVCRSEGLGVQERCSVMKTEKWKQEGPIVSTLFVDSSCWTTHAFMFLLCETQDEPCWCC